MKHRVIVTCNNYYATDSHFTKILWVKKMNLIKILKTVILNYIGEQQYVHGDY